MCYPNCKCSKKATAPPPSAPPPNNGGNVYAIIMPSYAGSWQPYPVHIVQPHAANQLRLSVNLSSGVNGVPNFFVLGNPVRLGSASGTDVPIIATTVTSGTPINAIVLPLDYNTNKDLLINQQLWFYKPNE